MNTHADPFDFVNKQLSVRTGTGKIFGQHLQLSVADAGIFKLQPTHDRLRDIPIRPGVGLKICIDHRPHLTPKEQPGAFEFDSSLARLPPKRTGIFSDDRAHPTVHSEPCREIIGNLQIDFFVTQIDPGHLRIGEEKLIP